MFDLKIIIPKAVLYELTKINGGESIDVSFDKESNQIIFTIGDTTLSQELLKANFLIMKNNSYKFYCEIM